MAFDEADEIPNDPFFMVVEEEEAKQSEMVKGQSEQRRLDC